METLLNKCHRVSNVSVRCRDGLVSSHKIILAGLSAFIRNILAGIPVGDEATLIMPDFAAADVERFLISWMENHDVMQPEDICRAFGRTTQVGHIKSETFHYQKRMKVESDDMIETSFEMVMKTEENSDEDIDQDELELDYKDLDSYSDSESKEKVKKVKFKKNKPSGQHHTKVGKREERAQKRMNEEFDTTRLAHIDEKIKYHEERIIPNPTTEKEVKKNKISESNIALQKSLREIVTTGCSNRRAAAKFGVSESSLRRFLSTPEKDIRGRGRKSRLFTQEEEERIAKRALDVSEGGLYMTINLLKKVLEEENEIMNTNHPERNLKIGQGYTVHFGERHNLFAKCRERKAFERENYEHQCDVCFGKYATEKLLNFHKSVTHFPFLNQHLNAVRRKKSMGGSGNSSRAPEQTPPLLPQE